ncbi:serendipity locus protein H-1 [Anastrepha obliqua]|uniref:serendipity locus protein H-1 n=1 Tax=Anastrepha obliqua TaxID=95512 RepID=UPI0024099872|nr:serendipity locus protein H-1 [Anastrepha obliqua]
MKEAPSSKKMPRKPRAPSTPTKMGANDEILSSLLRLNNFDSNIKDESLDIDLSACVTISGDSAAMLASTNSLSSTDFWRVLDDSAQNSHMDLTNASYDVQQPLISGGISDDGLEDCSIVDILPSSYDKNFTPNGDAKIVGGVIIKEEKPQPSFSGTFLRPEAPPPTPSPLKRLLSKPHQGEQPQRQPERGPAKEKIKRNFKKESSAIGQPYQLNATHLDDAAVDNIHTLAKNTIDIKRAPTNHVVVSSNKAISSSSFNIFTVPETNAPSFNSNSISNNIATLTSQAEGGVVKESAPQESGTNVPEPVFKCLDCDGLILQGRREYATHEAVGHRIHYRCSMCDRDFEQEAGLKKHIKTHRSTDPRKDAWKKCPDCGKCLKMGSMWMHRKIHSDNKKYGCDICGQKFVQKINLTHHSRIHTAEKPYECPECQKRFQERSHLQRHQKYHAQTRSYRCEKCGKMYKTERCLKVHNLVHLEQRPFACNVCDKSFISNSKLKQHSNIHTGERPFKCNYCPRDFTNFPNWLKHTRRRHKVDHKTGEHLENIPSYCSKKSTKSTKAKPADANTETGQPEVTTKPVPIEKNKATPVQNATVAGAIPKSQASKRKKKCPQQLPLPTPAQPPPLVSIRDNNPLPSLVVSASATVKTEGIRPTNSVPSIHLPVSENLKPIPAITTTNKIDTCKMPKPKRERKQPLPKQVQKSYPASTLLSSIKREITETEITSKSHATPSVLADTRCAISNFPDLSITSAEELIMEQALEMEECGMYVAQHAAAMDTDNAISSSEATAALHFKIKSEFDPMDLSSTRIKEEEYITLKDINQRLLCSSLESSPYSSPASVELTATPAAMPMVQLMDNNNVGNAQLTTAVSNSFHVNSFAVNAQRPTKTVTNLNNAMANQSVPELQHMLPQVTTQFTAPNSNSLPTATQAIINHFYLHPMTAMSMPLLAQSSTSQKLPSVDTLLFSAGATTTNVGATSGSSTASGGRFFHSNSFAQQAGPVGQPKLS